MMNFFWIKAEQNWAENCFIHSLIYGKTKVSRILELTIQIINNNLTSKDQ